MSASNRRLIINADDFGLNVAVNEGILKAHQEGVVTSVSLLVNTEGFEDALQKLKTAPRLDAGLHLNLFRGRWLTPFRFSLKAVYREFEAQIQKAFAHGLTPSHLDTEKHVHVFPPIFKIVLELAKKYRIPAVRFPYEPISLLAWRNPLQLFKLVGMLLFVKPNRKLLRASGLHSPQFFLGVSLSRKFSLENLQRRLEKFPFGIAELSCHPGLTPKSLSSYIDAYREAELKVLIAPALKEYFDANGIQRIRFTDLV